MSANRRVENYSYHSDVEIVENDEYVNGTQLYPNYEELKRLRCEVESLKSEKEKLAVEVDVLKEKMKKLEDARLPTSSGSSGGNKITPVSSQILSEAFRTVYEDFQRLSILNHKPVELVNTWRGIVEEKPEVVWTVNTFVYCANYSREFYISKYSVRCYVSVDGAAEEVVHAVPAVNVELDFEREEDMEKLIPPAIIVVVKGKNYRGEEKIYTERQNNSHKTSRSRYCYGRTSRVELIPHDCVSLEIEIYLEEPWSAQQLQSRNGILYWTAENFSELFRHQDWVLYSPYFRTLPAAAAAVDGHRLQVFLFSSDDNLLTLFVLKQNCEYVDVSNHVIKVTVLRPNSDPDRLSFVTTSDLSWGPAITLGRVEDIVENDTFLGRVEIVSSAASKA